ncbi:MAG: hypothetical protein IPN34_02180 [Planctomycetes bacterium]|nr:hypothetical protein [Planctomycetota bacterium]
MKPTLLLGRLRLSIRALYLLHGLGWFLAFAAGLLAVIYVGDRMLDYPRGVRLLQIFLFGPLAVYLLWRWVLAPAATPLTDDDLAVLIERSHPELRERFITALQAAQDPAIAKSAHPSLLAQVQREAEGLLAKIGIARALRPKPALYASGLGLGALALLALGAWSQGELAGIFARRLLAQDAPWPRRTELALVLKDRQGEVLLETVLRGEVELELPRTSSLRVEVRAIGDVPAEARFVTGGARLDKVSRQSQDEQSSAHFVHTYRDIAEGFEFWVESGDDVDREPLVRVTTYPAPVVRTLWSRVEPPSYLPAPLARAAAKALPHGNVSALSGSRAELVLLVEGETSRAIASLDPQPDPSWGERELERLKELPAAPEGLGFQASPGLQAFRLADLPIAGESPLQLRLFLEDKKGRRPERPNVYVITPQVDELPSAAVRVIGSPLRSVSPQALLLAVAEWSDDHDVARATWTAREDQLGAREASAAARALEREVLEATRAFDEREFLERRGQRQRTSYRAVVAVELSELAGAGVPTQPGSAVALLASATDRRPEAPRVDSASVTLVVVDERELLQRLSTSLEEIRAEAEQLRSGEQRFLALLEETRAAFGDAVTPGAWTKEDTRFDRAEAFAEARRLAERFSGLAQTVVLNRVGIGLDEREDTSAAAARAEMRETDALQRALRALVEAPESAEAALEAGLELKLLDALSRDPRTVSERPPVVALLEIGRDFASLALRELPGAQEAARALAEVEQPEAVLPALERLLAAQRRVCETAARICAGLHRWDSFESILLDFKRTLDNFLRFRRAFGDSDK